MERVVCLIDGFNLYHSLDGNGMDRYKWLDLSRLPQSFLKKTQKLEKVYYFTAYTHWNLNKKKRHQVYLKALKELGVEIVLGEFKQKRKKCSQCQKMIATFEEKRTDVNIAVKLMSLAADNKFETALIISGDSDFIPAIEEVKAKHPEKKIGVISPFGRKTEALKKACDFHMKIKEKHLQTNLLSDEAGNGIKKPKDWR